MATAADKEIKAARGRCIELGAAPIEVEALEHLARCIAREEVASLCGLVLNRVGASAMEGVEGDDATVRLSELRSIFGEALSDFSGHTAGDEPGPQEVTG